MQAAGSSKAVERVWRALSAEGREALAVGMRPTDLQTLLLSVAQARAQQVDAARLMRQWGEDRFVRPAAADPRRLAVLDALLWQHLPAQFEGVLLCTRRALGTCAAVAGVDQNRIVSTVRRSEVMSDPTNALAIEAAQRRRRTNDDIHVVACHRVLHGQRFHGPDAAAHFELFALVCSGRDRGAHSTELGFLQLHLRTWSTLLDETLGADA